ncbi:MAG TPA: hypothetical protein VF699_05620 [Caulobacteraceae bacterium]|jgi:hypothetical protein
MLRRAAVVGLFALLGACQANPKETVLNLDTTDPKWTSRSCVQHRKAVADYNDGHRTRTVVGLADYAVPFAGTVSSMLLSWRQDPHRAELNRRVQVACVSRAAVPHDRYARVSPYKTGRGARGGASTSAR